jgi:hypothetical protein
VQPTPDDVVDVLRAKYADDGPPTEDARSAERATEAARTLNRKSVAAFDREQQAP